MKFERPYRVLLILSVLALGITATIPGPSLKASGSGTSIQVWSNDYFSSDIVDDSLTLGSRFNIDILANNLPPIVDSSNGGINGFDVTVHYNSTVLKAVDASHKAPLCPAADNCLFDRSSALLLTNQVDNPPGTTRLAVVLVPGTVDGSGTLYRITFEVAGIGFTLIEIDPASTITGPVLGTVEPIPYKPVDGRFENRKPFRLDPNPTYASILPGQDAVYNIDVTQVWKIQNFTENISFGISGLPGDALANFTPTSGTLNFTTQLTISTTTATTPARYNVTVTGISGFSNTRVTTNITMVVTIIDVAVLRVASNPPNVAVGNDVTIDVDVKNFGNQAQTIDLNIRANGTAIFAITAITLAPLELQTVTRAWNTLGFPLGAYNISADIPPLSSETNLSNNNLSGGVVRVGSDFTLTLDQLSGNLIQGQALSVTLSVTLVTPAVQPELVSLSFVGLGSGVTVDFAPATDAPSFTSTLTLTASATATQGTFALQVNAASATFTRTASFTLAVLVAHDVAVTAVSSTPSVVNPGATTTIYVTVKNNGALPENFTVGVVAVPPIGPQITVGSTPVVNLQPSLDMVVSVSWTTTSVSSATYTFTASIAPLTGEQNTGDNSMSGPGTRINAKPTASFTFTPSSPQSGSSATFDASPSTDTDGSVATYSWNFGDGTSTTGKTATHTYSSTGSFNVTLTITDNNGATSTIAHTVTVVSPMGIGEFFSSTTGIALIILIIVVLIGIAVYLRSRKPKTPPVKPPSKPKT